MRRWLLLLVPLIVLVLVVALTRTLAQQRYVASAAPGDVLYAAGFDGFEDEWQQYADGQLTAEIANGALQLTVNTPGGIPFSLARPRFRDFDMTVEARTVAGPENNGFGVIFRSAQPERQTSATWQGLAQGWLENSLLGPEPDTTYYLFLISSDGFYSLQRSVNGRQREVSTWIPTAVVHRGVDATNTIRVVARGDAFQFFVNGQPMAMCIPDNPAAFSTYDERDGSCLEGQMLETIEDASISSGKIGLVAQSFDEPGVVIAFDNLIVIQPQAE